MNNIIVNKYQELLTFFEECLKETTSPTIKEDIKKSYLNLAGELAKLEGKEISYYQERINSFFAKKDDVEIETYIFNAVYKNKNVEIGDKLQKLVLELQEILKESDSKLIEEWVNKYVSFAETYKNELDKEKLLEYMKFLLKKHNKNDKRIEKVDKKTIDKNEINKDNTKEEIKGNEPLKIINIKKSNISKPMKQSLKVLALLGVGTTMGIPAAIFSYGIYKLNKKYKLGSKLISYLEKYGFKINHNNELLDRNEEVVTEEKIEKEKVGFLKKKLMNLNLFKDNGFIKNSYKKNKFTSMLLNMKIANSIKNKFKTNKEEEPLNNDNIDIHKGMVKC